jgi:hypothetical protein
VKRVVVLLFVLALSPTLAAAQRGGFGRRIPGLTREPGITIEKPLNMINLLIAHRQEVALTDSQFKRVIVLKRELDSTNAPQMRKLDSVARVFRGGAPIFAEPNPARRDSLAEARAVVHDAVAIVADNNAGARDQAYAFLNEQQVIKAREIEAKAEKELEESRKKP